MTNSSIQLDDSVQVDDLKTSQSFVHIPLWVSIVVIIGALLTATGAVISKIDPTLLTNGSPMTEAVRRLAWAKRDRLWLLQAAWLSTHAPPQEHL